MGSMRTVAQAAYANPSVDVYKVTTNPENNTVIARWRVSGEPRLAGSAVRDVLFEAVSTFTINNKGEIVHHHLATVMRRDVSPGLAASLLGVVGTSMFVEDASFTFNKAK